MPDETTICKFRHLLEAHSLGGQLFVRVQDYLQENGLKISRRTIVDATIIDAPRSTKNKDGQRDPEMRQTKKGNQWYFGEGIDDRADRRATIVAAQLPFDPA